MKSFNMKAPFNYNYLGTVSIVLPLHVSVLPVLSIKVCFCVLLIHFHVILLRLSLTHLT